MLRRDKLLATIANFLEIVNKRLMKALKAKKKSVDNL